MRGALRVRSAALLVVLLLAVVTALAGPTGVLPSADGALVDRPRSIVLSPTAQPSSSQTVTWRTTRATRGTLQVKAGSATRSYPARSKGRTTQRSSGENAYVYTATATGLTGTTGYRYRVVTGSASSPWYSFTTASRTARPTTVLAFGDTQVSNAGVPESIIDRAERANPRANLFLHAGDVVDRPWKLSEWKQYLQATSPTRHHHNWLVSIGNHEQCVLVRSCRSGAGQAFRSYYTWPRNGYPRQGATWFFTDVDGVRFVVLDTFGSDLERQGRFLDWALRTNPHRWSVVLQHAGPFAARADRSNPAVRRHLLPVIKKYDVDLVLSGHDHSYARGYQGSPNSTVFATSVSGKKFYPSSSRDWRAQRATRVKAASRVATYQVITVNGATLTYRAVVGYRGAGASGRVGVGATLDRVTITKTAAGAKTVR